VNLNKKLQSIFGEDYENLLEDEEFNATGNNFGFQKSSLISNNNDFGGF
jgi:hypothetical protein